MLRDVAVKRIKTTLGFKQNLDADIVQALVEVQEDLERSSELPFFLRKSYGWTAPYRTTKGVKSLAIPADFIREWDDDQMFMLNEQFSEYPVVKDQRGFLRLRWPVNLGEGTPIKYARTDKQFHFYPTPDKIYTITGTYYGKDVSFAAANVENLWLKELPFLLIARAGMMVASGLRDKEALGTFGMMNEIMGAKLHHMTTADDAAGSRPVIGGDED